MRFFLLDHFSRHPWGCVEALKPFLGPFFPRKLLINMLVTLIGENSASESLCQTGPNTPPIFLYIIRYMFELSENHSLMRYNYVAPRSILAQTWLIFEKSETGETIDLPNFAQTRRFNESA